MFVSTREGEKEPLGKEEILAAAITFELSASEGER